MMSVSTNLHAKGMTLRWTK